MVRAALQRGGPLNPAAALRIHPASRQTMAFRISALTRINDSRLTQVNERAAPPV
jgi:hypothetical protein